MTTARVTLLLCLLLAFPAASKDTAPTPENIQAKYGPIAQRIIAAGLKAHDGWNKMKALCDGIGPRLSGSPQLEQAVDWAAEQMKRDGHENVRKERVMVPKWVRGAESLVMTAPRAVTMPILGLGGSIGTPKAGITAQVVVVSGEAELKALGKKVAGKIVVFNNAMPKYDAQGHGAHYGKTVKYRVHGARLAAEHGAVAVLVRSVTAYSLHTPHTGAMHYGKAKTKIPAAAVTVEDATLMARLQSEGKPVTVTLKMNAVNHGKVASANVIGEIVGSERPEEIVILSGHLDSWDVGTGAHDDASGCVMAMEALSVLRRLGLRPRRTIRAVLWTNEENGLAGGKAYAKEHKAELKHHVAAVEADHGCFTPKGFRLEMDDPAAAKRGVKTLGNVLSLLAPIGATYASEGFAGADLIPMRTHGVPRMGLKMDGSTYFNYHHTHADTLDKIKPVDLTHNVIAFAVLAYVLADMPGRLGD